LEQHTLDEENFQVFFMYIFAYHQHADLHLTAFSILRILIHQLKTLFRTKFRNLYKKRQDCFFQNWKSNLYYIFVLSVLINSSITFSNIFNGNAPFNKTAKIKKKDIKI